MEPGRNPYAGLIGSAWSALPEAVRIAHTAPLRATGRFVMRRGRGRVRRWIADRLELPQACEELEVVLTVEDMPTGQVWTRAFAGVPMRTVQTFDNGCMIEAKGGIAVILRVEAVNECVTYRSIGHRVGALRLPAWAGPRLSATVRAGSAADCWHVCVRVEAPAIGLIGEYGGEMRRET